MDDWLAGQGGEAPRSHAPVNHQGLDCRAPVTESGLTSASGLGPWKGEKSEVIPVTQRHSRFKIVDCRLASRARPRVDCRLAAANGRQYPVTSCHCPVWASAFRSPVSRSRLVMRTRPRPCRAGGSETYVLAGEVRSQNTDTRSQKLRTAVSGWRSADCATGRDSVSASAILG